MWLSVSVGLGQIFSVNTMKQLINAMFISVLQLHLFVLNPKDPKPS